MVPSDAGALIPLKLRGSKSTQRRRQCVIRDPATVRFAAPHLAVSAARPRFFLGAPR